MIDTVCITITEDTSLVEAGHRKSNFSFSFQFSFSISTVGANSSAASGSNLRQALDFLFLSSKTNNSPVS